MKLLKRLFILIIIAAVISPVVAVVMMVDDTPDIPADLSLSPNDLSQAEVFLRNADPRELEPGEVSAFTVSARDLELLIGYALSQLHGGGARVALRQGLADVQISPRLPDNPLGEYVNLQMTVSQLGNSLAVENLRAGGVRVPGALADTVLQFAHEQMQTMPEYVAALDAINGYSISQDQINIVYQWQPEVIDQLSSRGRDLLISQEDQQRLLSHASNLSSITNDPRLPQEVSLAEVMGPAMLFAKVRGGDPVAENRAAILALAMYIMGVSVPRVLGMPEDSVPPMGRHHLMLSDRHDFAQHFLVSAGLTVSSGTGIFILTTTTTQKTNPNII